NNLIFNKNKEVNYTSTIVKDSNVLYNNVESVRKDVLRAESKKEIIDASVSLGVSAGLDTMEMKVSPGSITVGVKGSYDVIEEKENALNILENTKEVYNNVDNVSIRGL
ncbi:hypothetical protein, partial [Streptobacillus felis]|uniref:hypothetical protein n=1 Tax=Streptobacillus felis TaxID=1384509 RepID=UPI000AAEE782